MADWYAGGLEDDLRPRLFAVDAPVALATIVEADGGPRPVGSQMVVTPDAAWGFLSGGCIEDDVARHGREVLAEGTPRRLVYGRGSPFIDMPLPCGGRLDVLVERVEPGEPAVVELARRATVRTPALWLSDGVTRRCVDVDVPDAASARVRFDPVQRLAVVGSDAFALAIAGLGAQLGWEVVLIAPFGPAQEPPVPVRVSRLPVAAALDEIAPDRWTAVALATHDLDADEPALLTALRKETGYVGVLGSRRRLPERLARLRAAGLDEITLARLHAPIGLPIAACTPWEVSVAVIAEIISHHRGGRAPA